MKPAGRLIFLGTSVTTNAGLDRRVLDLGYDVVAVMDDPEEACARASESDLILIDLNLGGEGGGVRAFERVSRHHNIPVVMVAPRSEATCGHEGGSDSPYGCVHLPLEGRELQVVLQTAIIRHQVDIERRRLEAQMIASQKSDNLSVLSRHLTHDFNNVLQAMLGHAQLAALDLPPQARARAFLDQAVQSGMRGAALCRQFLIYSMPASSSPRIAELSTIIRESQVLLRTIVKKGVQMDFDLDVDLPHLDMQPSDVQQMLFNLALNASEAIGTRRGSLRVTTGQRWLRPAEMSAMVGAPVRVEGQYVFIEVSDDGCGISAQVAGRMFEPFFTTRFTGQGLGLTAVLSLANDNGGVVEVLHHHASAGASGGGIGAGAGTGTTFRVYLPAPRTQSAA